MGYILQITIGTQLVAAQLRMPKNQMSPLQADMHTTGGLGNPFFFWPLYSYVYPMGSKGH